MTDQYETFASRDRDEVADAAINYVKELCDYLREQASEGRQVFWVTQKEKWSRLGGHYRRTSSHWFTPIPSVIESGPSPADLIASLKADHSVSSCVGKMVGSFYGGSWRFTIESVVDAVVSTLASGDGKLECDAKAVREAVRKVRRDLTAKTRDFTLLIPLSGLQLDHPFEVQEGVELTEFTQEEVSALAETGILRAWVADSSTLWDAQIYGARVHLDTPSFITEPGEDVPDVWTSEQSRPHTFGYVSPARPADIVEDVLAALRLAEQGYVSAPGHLTMNPETMHGSSTSWSTRPGHSLPQGEYVVGESQRHEIRRVWDLMCSTAGPGEGKIPMIALRRYNAAADRPNLEDVLVDLIIAIEALLSGDLARDRTELSYRMALRGSILLAEAGDRRIESFQMLKAGYALRSKVTHGAELPKTVRITGRESSVDTPRFAIELTALVRKMMVAAAQSISSHSGFGTAAYWDRRILGHIDHQ